MGEELACYTCVYAPYAPACNNCLFDSNYIKKEKVNACSECEFFSDSRFYADNSILVSWGSCMKCQRNMTTTNPYQETPSWCPLKGEEDARDNS